MTKAQITKHSIPFSNKELSFEELAEIEALKESCDRPNSPLIFLGEMICPLYSLEEGSSDLFRSHSPKSDSEPIGLQETD